MADKYLKNNNGALKEVEGLTSSSGVSDAGKIPALDSTGRLNENMMPVGLGADTAQLISSDSLGAGNYINVWNDSGVFKVRKADATVEGKSADGFVLAAVAIGEPALVYFEGRNTQVSGMTPGSVYLSTTAGLGTQTPPSASGNVVQRLGVAVSATEVNFERGTPITLA